MPDLAILDNKKRTLVYDKSALYTITTAGYSPGRRFSRLPLSSKLGALFAENANLHLASEICPI